MYKRFYAKGLLIGILTTSLALLASCAGSPEETLTKIANDLNGQPPIEVDVLVDITNYEVFPNRTLKVSYVVKGIEGNNTDKEKLHDRMYILLKNRLKARQELEFYLVNNVRFEHYFYDEYNRELLNIKIEALDYKSW